MVWILFVYDEYHQSGERDVEGVFSSKELAQEFLDKNWDVYKNFDYRVLKGFELNPEGMK